MSTRILLILLMSGITGNSKGFMDELFGFTTREGKRWPQRKQITFPPRKFENRCNLKLYT